jgi:Ca2+-binding RTX toxin-like protein
VGLSLTAVALAPAAAHAAKAELSRDGKELRVDSGAGEASNLRVSFDGQKFVVEDLAGGDVNPGRDCRALVRKARCDGGFTTIVADLGTGDDRIDVQVNKETEIDGGSGADQIFGTDRRDEIDGGPGNDIVFADGDNDSVEGGAGDDILRGGPGLDSMTGGKAQGEPGAATVGGSDSLDGGEGDDNFRADPGADDYVGGGGTDELHYNHFASRVNVTFDEFANDGKAGEKDNIHLDVEFIAGSALGDNLTGSPFDNLLFASAGDDNLDGGDGEDFLNGGPGDDSIKAREEPPAARQDTVKCGTGTDLALVDLGDIVANRPEDGEVCESIEEAPVGQGPNVRIGRSRIKVSRSGRVRIPLSCPRAQPNGCRGTLGLTGAKGRARFALAPGQKTVARRRLARKHRSRLSQRRRGIRVKAVARERDPFGRPKTTSTIFRLRLRK